MGKAKKQETEDLQLSALRYQFAAEYHAYTPDSLMMTAWVM